MKESSLHDEIKYWYGGVGDLFEHNVDGYIVDVVRGSLLIEIQTGNFQKIKPKLIRLLTNHLVRIVYPVAVKKWVSRYDVDMVELISRRISPVHGRIEDLFSELIYLPELPLHPNFSLDVLLIEQEDIWVNDGKGSWTRKYWSRKDRKLVKVYRSEMLSNVLDYLKLLPQNLPRQFSSYDVAIEAGISRKLARRMLYCLSRMNLISFVRVSDRNRLYCRTQ